MTRKIIKLLRIVFFISIILHIFSCSQKNEQELKTAKTAKSLALPKQIVLANLPDTSQPKQIFLDKRPAPQTTRIPVIGSKSNLKFQIYDGQKIKLDVPSVYLHINPKNQQPIAAEAQGAGFFSSYTTDNGLALDAISSGIMDKKGNLWFGSVGAGLSRFDGKSFTNFSTIHGLKNNVVLSIAEDKSGNIWLGTDGGGVSKYDGKSFTNFTTAQGLTNNSVYSIKVDKIGNIWFGTHGGGLSRYDGKSFVNFTTAQGLANNNLRCIAEDKNGIIWIGTANGGLSRYDGKSFANIGTAQGLAAKSINCITEDKSGNLWMGTDQTGLSRYDGKTFTHFTTAQGLAYNHVISITEDKMGVLWIGTHGGGMSRYDGKSFVNFTTAQGLANNIVWSITEDKTGNLWIGTEGGGLSRYEGKSFTNFTTAQGLADNTVWSINEDKKGVLWFGSDAGLIRYDSKSVTNFTMSQGLANNTFHSIIEDKIGNLWLGTYDGVIRYDGKSFTNFTTAQGLTHNTVLSITKDKKGNLWFGTSGGGLSRFDGKSFTNFKTLQGLSDNFIWCVTEDKLGNIWVGTDGGGVSRFDGKSFTNFTTEQGLADNTVLKIKEDKNGNLWFCTFGGGLSRYDGKSFANFTTTHGLPDNIVTQLLLDSQQNHQNIVFGTNFGLGVLVGFSPKPKTSNTLADIPAQNNLTNKELENYRPKFEIYNSSTGYPVKDVNTGNMAMFKDSKSIIWIGTGSSKTGLVRFDYNSILKNTNLPQPYIQSIKINDAKIIWNNLSLEPKIDALKLDSNTIAPNIIEEVNAFGKVSSQADRDSMRTKYRDVIFDQISNFYPIPQNLILPYKHNSLTFDFNAIETSRNYLVRYQYMLDGYDNDWGPITEKSSATFGNMFEGNYTFKLKARSPSGVWSKPLEYNFRVLPPWWRTYWMYVLYIAILLLLIAGFVMWRERNLKREKIELEEKIEVRTIQLSEKNKEITDSINYALRIQEAILPDKQQIYACLPQSFVLYKPKDIVSGDFYFFVKNEKLAFIAAADCTGHGVPGAMMSMLGIERLNDAVQKSNDTTQILTLLNKAVKKSLKQSDSNESTRDGMDIALCSIDIENRIIRYAGSNRPIWIIRGGQSQVEEIIATRKAIGGLTNNDQHFDTHQIQLHQGDTFYISTDGYADTFGGQNGKKLMTKKFKQMLIDIQAKTMQEQEVYLDNFIEEWKAGANQIDDILVIGVRV